MLILNSGKYKLEYYKSGLSFVDYSTTLHIVDETTYYETCSYFKTLQEGIDELLKHNDLSLEDTLKLTKIKQNL